MQEVAQLPYDAALQNGKGGGITSVCWGSKEGTEILTGHDDGAVLRWGVSTAGSIEHLDAYSVVPAAGQQRDPVVSIDCLFGEPRTIVVRGGNLADVPQSLSLIKPQKVVSGEEQAPVVQQIPWFGPLQVRNLDRFSSVAGCCSGRQPAIEDLLLRDSPEKQKAGTATIAFVQVQGYALARPAGSFDTADAPTAIMTLWALPSQPSLSQLCSKLFQSRLLR